MCQRFLSSIVEKKLCVRLHSGEWTEASSFANSGSNQRIREGSRLKRGGNGWRMGEESIGSFGAFERGFRGSFWASWRRCDGHPENMLKYFNIEPLRGRCSRSCLSSSWNLVGAGDFGVTPVQPEVEKALSLIGWTSRLHVRMGRNVTEPLYTPSPPPL